MNSRNIWHAFGYFGIIYLIFLLLLVVGFPLAQHYATPLVSRIFPLDPSNSMTKSLVVMSVMYWLMVGGYLLSTRKKKT